MEVKVDQDLCISCGLCISSCPEVFIWNDDEKAETTKAEVSDTVTDCVKDAAAGCPTDAILTN